MDVESSEKLHQQDRGESNLISKNFMHATGTVVKSQPAAPGKANGKGKGNKGKGKGDGDGKGEGKKNKTKKSPLKSTYSCSS